jgi:hypothetical protein
MMALTLVSRIRCELDAACEGKVHDVFQVACEFHMNAINVNYAVQRFALFNERFRIVTKL